MAPRRSRPMPRPALRKRVVRSSTATRRSALRSRSPIAPPSERASSKTARSKAPPRLRHSPPSSRTTLPKPMMPPGRNRVTCPMLQRPIPTACRVFSGTCARSTRLKRTLSPVGVLLFWSAILTPDSTTGIQIYARMSMTHPASTTRPNRCVGGKSESTKMANPAAKITSE